MIPYPLHFSIVTSFSWLKNMEYLRPLQNYLPLIDEPFELVQSRDGIMVHLHDIAGSSGEDPGCNVTLRQQEHSYCPSQFPGFWTWWEWCVDLEKALTCTVSAHDWFLICNKSYPFNFFDIVFLFLHLSSLSLKSGPHDLLWNEGLQFAIWKAEKQQLSVSIDFVQPPLDLEYMQYSLELSFPIC